jgi:flagellar biosynthesis/type III secretory pathway chaperone
MERGLTFYDRMECDHTERGLTLMTVWMWLQEKLAPLLDELQQLERRRADLAAKCESLASEGADLNAKCEAAAEQVGGWV